ncbi:MAG: hypothetical protein K9K86_10575 [Pseudomonadales bacterium]|nr:hypothetical protein [Pseudomonadales bacterium]
MSMPISSQASEASEEGSETRWSDANSSRNTPLASSTPPIYIEGDDIVHAIAKALD